MYVYTPGQWALLFFFYCFCGWVWESCYVSAKQRHWVNRGFLHGPLLPIYGSGAIIILFATLPVADNFWLVYFLGMLAATALEYVVGAVMEQLFKVPDQFDRLGLFLRSADLYHPSPHRQAAP